MVYLTPDQFKPYVTDGKFNLSRDTEGALISLNLQTGKRLVTFSTDTPVKDIFLFSRGHFLLLLEGDFHIFCINNNLKLEEGLNPFPLLNLNLEIYKVHGYKFYLLTAIHHLQ